MPKRWPTARPISMPSVVSTKVVKPIEAAMTQMLAPMKARPTPTAAASMLVPTAVAISPHAPDRRGASLIAAGIGLTVLAYFFTRISRTVLFWIAFVLTRPFGATMGDLLTKTPDKGGLGFGTIGSTAVLLAILVAMVLMTTWSLRAKKRRAVA